MQQKLFKATSEKKRNKSLLLYIHTQTHHLRKNRHITTERRFNLEISFKLKNLCKYSSKITN